MNGDGVGILLTATDMSIVDKKEYGYIEYTTAPGIHIPDGSYAMVFPLDTIADTGLILAASVQILPPGRHETINLKFKYISNTAKYEVGDAVAKLILFHTNFRDTSPTDAAE